MSSGIFVTNSLNCPTKVAYSAAEPVAPKIEPIPIAAVADAIPRDATSPLAFLNPLNKSSVACVASLLGSEIESIIPVSKPRKLGICCSAIFSEASRTAVPPDAINSITPCCIDAGITVIICWNFSRPFSPPMDNTRSYMPAFKLALRASSIFFLASSPVMFDIIRRFLAYSSVNAETAESLFILRSPAAPSLAITSAVRPPNSSMLYPKLSICPLTPVSDIDLDNSANLFVAAATPSPDFEKASALDVIILENCAMPITAEFAVSRISSIPRAKVAPTVARP